MYTSAADETQQADLSKHFLKAKGVYSNTIVESIVRECIN